MRNKSEWKSRKQGESIHVILEFTSDKEGKAGIVRYDIDQ
jgi:hypothetical protein